MFLPDRVGHHLYHHRPEWFVGCFCYLIEQSGEAQTSGLSLDLGQLVFEMTIRIMQFEHKLVAIRNARGEVTITGIDPGNVEISPQNAAQRVRRGRV